MQNAETTVCACGTVQAQGTTSTESSPLTVTAHITLYRASEARLDREEIGQRCSAALHMQRGDLQRLKTPPRLLQRLRKCVIDGETLPGTSEEDIVSRTTHTTNMQIMSLEALRRSP
ncbi:hypothetical protein Bbelb_413130 [Branchiostoma belcheri]|nr:hypothetical protein Bbelb_413130 [Branchiostoma belcheri]